MDDIKLFAKNETELETLVQAVRIYSQDIGMEFGIEKCTMLIRRSRKRQMTEGIEQPNQEKSGMLEEKETYYYLGILEVDTIKQVGMKEKIKKVSQENKKTTQNQIMSQKSHQRSKHLGCFPCQMLRMILKVNKGRTSTNLPENKKTNNDAWSLTSER